MTIFLIIRGLVPVGHEKERLNERDPINFIVEVVEQPCFLKEVASRVSSCHIACSFKVVHADIGDSREHDSLEEEQTNGVLPTVAIDRVDQVVQVQERHVRIDELSEAA